MKELKKDSSLANLANRFDLINENEMEEVKGGILGTVVTLVCAIAEAGRQCCDCDSWFCGLGLSV